MPQKKTTAKKKPAAKKTTRKPGRQPTDRQPKKTARPADDGTVRLHLDRLTNRDILDFEEVTGLDINDALANSSSSYRSMCAIVWLALRQKRDPDLTFDGVLDMTADQMRAIDIELVDGDPEGDAAASRD